MTQVFDVQAAHELLGAGRYGEVIAVADDFLRRAGTAVTCQVHALLKKAAAMRRSGSAWECKAIEVLEDALERLGDTEPVLRARTLANLMAVYSNSSARQAYANLLREYLGICESHEEARQWLFHAYYNAGMNAVCDSDYEAAVEANIKAVEYARNDLEAAQAKHNLANAYIILEQLEAAAPLIESVKGLLPAAQFGAKLANTEARYRLIAGDLQAALQTIEAGLRHPSLTPEVQADLQLTQAMAALRAGELGEAKRLALLSLDGSFKCSYRRGANEASKFYEGVTSR